MEVTFLIVSAVLTSLVIFLLWKWLSEREDHRWYREQYKILESRLVEERRLRREDEHKVVAESHAGATLAVNVREHITGLQEALEIWGGTKKD